MQNQAGSPLDYICARMRSDAFAELPVHRMYEMTNRWGGVEFSVGRSGYERCVKSLFPHFGYVRPNDVVIAQACYASPCP